MIETHSSEGEKMIAGIGWVVRFVMVFSGVMLVPGTMLLLLMWYLNEVGKYIY